MSRASSEKRSCASSEKSSLKSWQKKVDGEIFRVINPILHSEQYFVKQNDSIKLINDKRFDDLFHPKSKNEEKKQFVKNVDFAGYYKAPKNDISKGVRQMNHTNQLKQGVCQFSDCQRLTYPNYTYNPREQHYYPKNMSDFTKFMHYGRLGGHPMEL